MAPTPADRKAALASGSNPNTPERLRRQMKGGLSASMLDVALTAAHLDAAPSDNAESDEEECYLRVTQAYAADYAAMHRWSRSVHSAQAIFDLLAARQLNHRAAPVEAALNGILSSSGALLRRLGSPRWGLRSTPTVNPVHLLHERIVSAVRLLLLVRVRVCPKLPPEIWSMVIRYACGAWHDARLLRRDRGAWHDQQARPIVRHYGYAPDGSLRVALDPPLPIPKLGIFRHSVGAVLTTLSGVADPNDVARHAEIAFSVLPPDARTRLCKPSERTLTIFFLLPMRAQSNSAWDRVRALIAAFELPVAPHMLYSDARVRLNVSSAPGRWVRVKILTHGQ